jgi:hypothetical protein
MKKADQLQLDSCTGVHFVSIFRGIYSRVLSKTLNEKLNSALYWSLWIYYTKHFETVLILLFEMNNIKIITR